MTEPGPGPQGSTANDTPLSIRGLEKSFRSNSYLSKIAVLRGVDLEVGRGEIFGFLGPNGAGKTTTIRIVMGLMRASRGTVEILGRDPSSTEARRHVGFLPEQPYFYDYLTVREILTLVADLHELSGDLRRRRIGEVAERLHLGPRLDQPLRKLSKGWLQRVGMAQALVNDPDLVIMDEPMSGLDPVGRREIRELILSLKEAGKTVFFSSHILPDAELLCDRVGIIVEGRVRYTGRLDRLGTSRPDFVELVVAGLAPERLAEHARVIKHDDAAGTVVLRLDDADRVDAVLSDVLASGGRVRSVTPGREGLEDIFERALSGSAAGDGATA